MAADGKPIIYTALAARLIFVRGLTLPPNANYANPAVKQIADRLYELHQETVEQHAKLMAICDEENIPIRAIYG